MTEVIVKCEIERGTLLNRIWVTVNTGDIMHIGRYYPDELHFDESEFVGLTIEQAKKLIHERDVAYLRS